MALRILHTADWHLGHSLHGFDRAHEHEAVLEWLLQVVEDEEVDALLVAGDVFDAANPPTEAQHLWYRFLVDAWKRVERLQIVVIGGNHDSAARLEATDPFLRALDRLHVVGGVARRGGEVNYDRHAVPLRGRDGEVAAWVAAVPYLRAAETGAGEDGAVAAGTRRFYDEVLGRIRARREPGQAIVAMGHLYLVGGQVSELSERRLTAGNQVAVGDDLFPDDIAYVALGHLHLAQGVGGREHVRYAGSLIPLALDEREYPHQAVLIDLDGEEAGPVRTAWAPHMLDLPRIPKKGAASVEEVLTSIRALPARGERPDAERPLLDVEVRLDEPEPGLIQRIQEALRGKDARLARLRKLGSGSGHALGDAELRSIADLLPEEVFRAKWRKHHCGEPPPELVGAFHELLALVQGEAR